VLATNAVFSICCNIESDSKLMCKRAPNEAKHEAENISTDIGRKMDFKGGKRTEIGAISK
jgi:hypothetical protein